MYSYYDYAWMMEDEVRNAAYLAALGRAVKPGSVVVDLGAGVGTWAFICCRFGAGRVYAIEMSPAIQLARPIAAANGFSDRVELIQAFSTEVQLPERADVIVFEIHGQQPIFEGSLATIIDARERFLKPDGLLIPARERLWAAAVQAPDVYDRCVGFWDRPFHGLDLSPAKPAATDWMYKQRFQPGELISDRVCYHVLDYSSITGPDLISEFHLTVERDGSGHGLHFWFDSELDEGIRFSTAPGSPRTIFGGTFIPWRQPVGLERGDEVEVTFGFRWVTGVYIWQCLSRISRGGKVKAQFTQSNLTQNLPNLRAT